MHKQLEVLKAQGRVPSIFSVQEKETLTPRYNFVNSVDALTAFLNAGWNIKSATQKGSLNKEVRNYQKHMVILQHPELALQDVGGDQVRPQAVYINSHDGKCSHTVQAGIFRMVCSNGLIVMTKNFGILRFRHDQEEITEINNLHARFVEQVPAITNQISRFQGLDVPKLTQIEFAKQAFEVRWPWAPPSIDYQEILNVRRPEDEKPSLWNVYNRVQENLVEGDLEGKTAQGRVVKTRKLKNVDNLLRVNRGLWDLTLNTAKQLEKAA